MGKLKNGIRNFSFIRTYLIIVDGLHKAIKSPSGRYFADEAFRREARGLVGPRRSGRAGRAAQVVSNEQR